MKLLLIFLNIITFICICNSCKTNNNITETEKNTNHADRQNIESSSEEIDSYLKSESLKDEFQITLLSAGYYKDSEKVYLDGEIVEGADPDTFNSTGNPFAYDKDSVYSGIYKINNADKDTLRGLDMDYAKDKNQVYYIRCYQCKVEIIEKADSNSFKTLGYGYAKDKHYVYKSGKILINENPENWNFRETYLHYTENLK